MKQPSARRARREFLAAGFAIAGLALGACAPLPKLARRERTPLRLTPPDLAWSQISATLIGCRPRRDGGFRVAAERLGETLLVHNYGHGGAGMSLSWGCAELAAELVVAGLPLDAPRRATIIGCGVIGLSCARQLQRRGFAVTIMAAALPPDVTSSKSLAAFTPLSNLIYADDRTAAWDAQFVRAAQRSYRELESLLDGGYGISWLPQYSLSGDAELPEMHRQLADLETGLTRAVERLDPGEHPFPTRYAFRRQILRIEPGVYLPALMRDVRLAGGRIVRRSFESLDELQTLPDPVLVNCSGMGAQTLVGDESLEPVKGQLTLLRPDAAVDYATHGGIVPLHTPGTWLQMMPRADGIVLGGLSRRGDGSLAADPEEEHRVVAAHIELFSRMRA